MFCPAGVPPGNCVIRTNDLGDPGAFRGRDASGGYTVRWQSAYVGGESGWGLCATNRTTPLAAHVCWREVVAPNGESGWPTYIATGDLGGHQPDGAVKYSWSFASRFQDAVADWTPSQVLLMLVCFFVSLLFLSDSMIVSLCLCVSSDWAS